ncbi:MAG: UbiA family prenyltransferase [Methanolinea sp.]|jgi:4-hydroxybenzoate polyprenyltransferase|nr:UbiA family prenyltransferase [Methanolinea sp.]
MEYAGSYHHEITRESKRNFWFELAGKTWEFFLYSSLFLGTAAVGMAFISCLIQGMAFSLSIAATLGLVVFSVYNLNRKTDEAEDALNHASRFLITSSYSRPLLALAIAAYAAALCIAASFGIAALAVTTVPLLSGILYSSPLLPPATGYRRLKEIPVGKNLVVSFAWGFAFSLVPATMHGNDPGPASLVAFLFIFSWTFIASTLPDIRDRTGDAEIGVLTIPVLLGVPRTRLVLTAFNLLSGILLLLAGTRVLPPAIIAVIVISLLYSQVCILCIASTRHDDFLCDVISDGQFLVIAIVGYILISGYENICTGLMC